jgi:hypothetical protein
MSMPVYLIAKCRRCGRRLSGWKSQVCHCDKPERYEVKLCGVLIVFDEVEV